METKQGVFYSGNLEVSVAVLVIASSLADILMDGSPANTIV
jgi:hypothetical protein